MEYGLNQEGYIEELSTWFYLDTALPKSSKTWINNLKMIDTHFKSLQNQFLHLDTVKISSIYPSWTVPNSDEAIWSCTNQKLIGTEF